VRLRRLLGIISPQLAVMLLYFSCLCLQQVARRERDRWRRLQKKDTQVDAAEKKRYIEVSVVAENQRKIT
jgi:hypothetical protein